MAICVRDMFGSFYLVKNHKIATNSTATKAREKNKHRFGILRILENLLIGINFVMTNFFLLTLLELPSIGFKYLRYLANYLSFDDGKIFAGVA